MTATASISDFSILSIAGPENIPWVQMAKILVAPASFNLRTNKNIIKNNFDDASSCGNPGDGSQ